MHHSRTILVISTGVKADPDVSVFPMFKLDAQPIGEWARNEGL
jgi:hypothetical protein